MPTKQPLLKINLPGAPLFSFPERETEPGARPSPAPWGATMPRTARKPQQPKGPPLLAQGEGGLGKHTGFPILSLFCCPRARKDKAMAPVSFLYEAALGILMKPADAWCFSLPARDCSCPGLQGASSAGRGQSCPPARLCVAPGPFAGGATSLGANLTLGSKLISGSNPIPIANPTAPLSSQDSG